MERIKELEASSAITEMKEIRRVTGAEHHYRIRVGHYRLGFAIEGNMVVLVRFLHRSEIYPVFP